MIYENNQIDCAIIHVDINGDSNSISTYGRTFSVRIKDIEETMKFIKEVYEELGLPYSRIYLSGFALLTESCIWTKQRILSSIKNDVDQIMSINNISKTR